MHTRLLELAPGQVSRSYTDCVQSSGASAEAAFRSQLLELLDSTLQKLEVVAAAEDDGGGEGGGGRPGAAAESEPAAEVAGPEFKYAAALVADVQSYLVCEELSAQWALFRCNGNADESKTWAVTNQDEWTKLSSQALPSSAFLTEQDVAKRKQHGPLSASKATQDQCAALCAFAVLWRREDWMWIGRSGLPAKLLAAALHKGHSLQRFYWALLHSVILAAFGCPTADSGGGESAGGRELDDLREAILHTLIEAMQTISHSDDDLRRMVALLATCYPSTVGDAAAANRDSAQLGAATASLIKCIAPAVVPEGDGVLGPSEADAHTCVSI